MNTWLPIDDAPRDGTVIVGKYGDRECEVRWAQERQCMLAGYAGGYGYFGEGWEDVYNRLIADEPDAFMLPNDETSAQEPKL